MGGFMSGEINFKQPVIKAYGATNIGQRKRNEDYFLVDEDLRLFVVADGMGGLTAGNFASCFASGRIRMLFNFMREMTEPSEPTLGGLPEGTSGASGARPIAPEGYIKFAIWDANKKLKEVSAEIETEKRMGTTVVGAFFWGGRVYIFNVGDSRGYRIYRGSMQQITTDHSVVERRIQEGELTPEEAMTAKGRNIITRAIGPKDIANPDIHVLHTHTGDRFLLCSDGLSNMVAVNPNEIKEGAFAGTDPDSMLTMQDFVFKKSLKEISTGLVELARRRGGRDNITAVAIEVLKGGRDLDIKVGSDAELLEDLAEGSMGFDEADEK